MRNICPDAPRFVLVDGHAKLQRHGVGAGDVVGAEASHRVLVERHDVVMSGKERI